MPAVLQAISSMEQLMKLDFSNNSPIVTFHENYQQLADRSSITFCALAACLDRLKKLKELRIQGLWLKPHAQLGTGIHNGVSQEIAILTGIMNYENKQGITALIDSISKLSDLENLSMDGIPSCGSSFVDRQDRRRNLHHYTNAISSLMALIAFKNTSSPIIFTAAACVAFTPLMISNGDSNQQSENLKKLSIESAARLTEIPSLKTVDVYSPGGDCVDYFSKTFKEELAKRQSDRAQTLSIFSSTLD